MASNGMKYIIIEGYTDQMPFVFPAAISHDVFYDGIKHIGKLISAGFVDITDCGLSAYGESISLDCQSNPLDTEIILRHLGFEC